MCGTSLAVFAVVHLPPPRRFILADSRRPHGAGQFWTVLSGSVGMTYIRGVGSSALWEMF